MTKFKLPAHREEVEEFFNFMDRDYDGNLSFEVFSSWFFSGSILVTLGYLVLGLSFLNLFWRLVFRGIFYLRLLFFKLFFSFSCLLGYFVFFFSNSFFVNLNLDIRLIIPDLFAQHSNWGYCHRSWNLRICMYL